MTFPLYGSTVSLSNDAAEEVKLADVSEVVAERLEEEIEARDHCDLGCAIV
jgi:hypothetical protein